MMKPLQTLLISALAIGGAQAAVTLTNLGTTAPTGTETGNFTTQTTGANVKVFGFRSGNTHGQTFTVSSPGITLEKIYVGYGALSGAATSSNITLTVDAGNNGSNEITETFTLQPSNITQGGTAGVMYWLELDVSSNALALPSGISSFLLTVNSITGATNTWLLAPAYTSVTDVYTPGVGLGFATATNANMDANFAISGSPVPEPSIALLGGLGALGLLRRRRA